MKMTISLSMHLLFCCTRAHTHSETTLSDSNFDDKIHFTFMNWLQSSAHGYKKTVHNFVAFFFLLCGFFTFLLWQPQQLINSLSMSLICSKIGLNNLPTVIIGFHPIAIFQTFFFIHDAT